jgi:hypothetical protein
VEYPYVRVVRTFPRSLPKHIGPWAEFVGSMRLQLEEQCRRLGVSPMGEMTWEEIDGGGAVKVHEVTYEFRMHHAQVEQPNKPRFVW